MGFLFDFIFLHVLYSMKNFKELYSFTKNKTITTKEVTKEIKDGKEIEISTPVEKQIPIKILIKSPSRSEREDLDLFYAVKFNKYITAGLLTREMIAKKYNDAGGILTEEEQKDYAKKLYDLYGCQQELIKLETLGDKITDSQKTRKEDSLKKLIELKQNILDFEMHKEDLFRQTADYKARDQAILWCILNLSYTQTEDDENPVPYFEGKAFEDKKNNLESREDLNDKLFNEIYREINYFVQFWYMGLVKDAKSFEAVKKEIEDEESKK